MFWGGLTCLFYNLSKKSLNSETIREFSVVFVSMYLSKISCSCPVTHWILKAFLLSRTFFLSVILDHGWHHTVFLLWHVWSQTSSITLYFKALWQAGTITPDSYHFPDSELLVGQNGVWSNNSPLLSFFFCVLEGWGAWHSHNNRAAANPIKMVLLK